MRTRWKVLGGAGLVGASLSFFIVIGHSRVSRGDTTSTATTTGGGASQATGTGVAAAAEPITGVTVTPAPGWATTPKDPFAPYDIGPSKWNTSPKPFWEYADLNASEKAWADRNADTTGWDNIHNAYAQAAAEQALRAASASAASQLGVDNLGSVGVVP